MPLRHLPCVCPPGPCCQLPFVPSDEPHCHPLPAPQPPAAEPTSDGFCPCREYRLERYVDPVTWLHCPVQALKRPEPVPQGWQCPKCLTVYAPWALACTCQQEKE